MTTRRGAATRAGIKRVRAADRARQLNAQDEVARLRRDRAELLEALKVAAFAEIVWHAHQKSWRALIARIEGEP